MSAVQRGFDSPWDRLQDRGVNGNARTCRFSLLRLGDRAGRGTVTAVNGEIRVRVPAVLLRGVAQFGRAKASVFAFFAQRWADRRWLSGSLCRRFESDLPDFPGPVAHLEERLPCKQEVVGALRESASPSEPDQVHLHA